MATPLPSSLAVAQFAKSKPNATGVVDSPTAVLALRSLYLRLQIESTKRGVAGRNDDGDDDTADFLASNAMSY